MNSKPCLGLLVFSLIIPALAAANEPPVFQDSFNAPSPGDPPATPPWSSISDDPETRGTVRIREDSDNRFGRGAQNQYLEFDDIGNNATILWGLDTIEDGPEVFTVSFDFLEPDDSGGNRFVVNLYNADTDASTPDWLGERIHRLQFESGSFRDFDGTFYSIGIAHRMDFVVNASPEAVTYPYADGDRTLDAGSGDIWIDGELARADFPATAPGPLRGLDLRSFSNSPVTMYVDDFAIHPGAIVSDPPEPLPPGYSSLVYPGDDGRLVYRPDERGNRIPDFSNAGYLGGGVPIPDVPAQSILAPEPGDDTQRIQNAIDQVSNLPLNDDGFRGAVVLQAGTFEVSGTLRIHSSGVVLRGAGDGEDGTVLAGTSTSQAPLIRVEGSGWWSEVSGTRKEILDDYVPVGARSFEVENTEGLEVGDSVIVHRPSTEEWISAIGMDEIPERHDGAEVNQWQAGDYDIFYDRILTGIEGNTVTLDAPVVNALEEEFGGGSIYKYRYPGRISQVGVEDIRGVSRFAGDPEDEDEDHAWTMVRLDRVRNAWARNLTGLHFPFGTVDTRRYAKWVTVENCRYLEPVSRITGSRRYPFYITGQLTLVTDSFASDARHDYATNSRTHGPNVFLRNSAVNSHTDTGPHHRWATGTLYDNIDIPDNAINVQNRLNFGSGHGWAGANHVIWNSSADRIANQNPPTARNWAIGVRGNRWPGHFPDYAEEGYWESHGTPVKPESLYERQLEERLDPEQGEGGMIATVNFVDLGTTPRLAPDRHDSIAIPVGRRGVDDHRIRIDLRLDGPGADSFSTSETGTPVINARSSDGEIVLSLGSDSFIPEETTVTVALRHGPGYSAGKDSEIDVILEPRAHDAWLAEHFSESQREDPSVSGDSANPAGDGIPNLLKFALALDPWKPAVPGDLLTQEIDGDALLLTHLRRPESAGITYHLDVSNDLENWSSGTDVLETVSTETEGELERVVVAAPLSDSETQRFFRLRVEREAP